MSVILLLAGTIATSVIFSYGYFRYASVKGPYAVPNHRSLHKGVIPRGGGLAPAVAVLIGIAILYATRVLSGTGALIFLVGGIATTIAGAADDRFDIAPKYRLLMQLAAVGWVAVLVGGAPPLRLGFATFELGVAGDAFLLFAVLWFYNLYNFVDGADGMAASATVFVSGTMSAVLYYQGQRDLALILALLASANLGFLTFNWPPARMFLGDAGTTFTSFVLSAVILISLWRDAVSIYVWFIALGYYFADTSTTTVIRALTVPHFHRGHRSHAYQNLTRIWNSHLKVLALVLAINVCWVLPILVLAVRKPGWSPLATVVLYVPLILFVLKFGPLFEDK